MLWFSYLELKQIKRLKSQIKTYFNDFWNIHELIFLSSYFIYVPTSYILTPDRYFFKVLLSIIVFSTLIKLLGYMRIFDDFGFLVQMITQAIRDSKNFVLFFLIILSSFAVQMSFLTTGIEFFGIGQAMYLIDVIRSVLADPQLIALQTDYEVLFWIVWLLLVFIGQLVLMNFIVAVMADSYKKCMDTRTQLMMKLRLDMIVEREYLMAEKELENEAWYPNYIIYRKNHQEEQELDILVQIQSQLNDLKQELNAMDDEGRQRYKEQLGRDEEAKKRRDKKDATPTPAAAAATQAAAKADTSKVEEQVATLSGKIDRQDGETKKKIESLEAKLVEQAQATKRVEDRMAEIQSSIAELANLVRVTSWGDIP